MNALRAGSLVTGQVTVGTAAVQLPDQSVRWVWLRAPMTNGMNEVLAFGPQGLAINGTAGGFLLMTGDTSPILYVSNLRAIWAVASATGQLLLYVGGF